MKFYRTIPLFVLAAAAGCTPTIKTQNEITVKPVQVTVDVNLNVKVDQAIAEEIAAPAPAQKSTANDERTLRRKRFAERRAALNSALKEKLIGENNRGFLELRADDTKVSAELKTLVEAENADRTTIFTNIARRQNSTPEFVGERFAARMGERAPSGIPIQNAQGEWNVKP